MAQLLLTKGAHVNAADKKDRKPIHWAAYMGKCSCTTGSHGYQLIIKMIII